MKKKEENESSRIYEKKSGKVLSHEATSTRNKFEFLKKISVEPCMFLWGLGVSLVGVQVSTLYIQKTCKVGSFFFGNQTFSNEVLKHSIKQFPVVVCIGL